MSEEIKIQYNDVEQALTKVRSSSNAFQTTLPTSIGGQNVLDIVETINRLNQSLQQVNELYKTLLLSNKDTTEHSIQSMRTTDEQLSTHLKVLK